MRPSRSLSDRHRARGQTGSREIQASSRRMKRGRTGSTRVEELAQFVAAARWDDVAAPVREQLKLRVLDSLGCALGALGAEVPAVVRAQVEDFGGDPLCTLIGGGWSAPDRAA